MPSRSVRIGALLGIAVFLVAAMFGSAYYFDKNPEGISHAEIAEEPSVELLDNPAPAPSTEEFPEPSYEDPSEKDSDESLCIQQGLEWDGLNCYQPQLPEETEGRSYEPLPTVPPVTVPEDNSCG